MNENDEMDDEELDGLIDLPELTEKEYKEAMEYFEENGIEPPTFPEIDDLLDLD